MNAITAVVAYYKHHSFTKNKPISQQTDRNILEAFRSVHGNKGIATLATAPYRGDDWREGQQAIGATQSVAGVAQSARNRGQT